MTAEIEHDLFCANLGCGAFSDYKFGPGNHVVTCDGDNACESSRFAFATGSKTFMDCNHAGACVVAEIRLYGASCLHLRCAGTERGELPACAGATIAKTADDVCFYTGAVALLPDGCYSTDAVNPCGDIPAEPACCRTSCEGCCPTTTTTTRTTTTTTTTTMTSTATTTTHQYLHYNHYNLGDHYIHHDVDQHVTREHNEARLPPKLLPEPMAIPFVQG